MADPLTALGAVAGAAQLADLACRLSVELFGFFRALKDASKERNGYEETMRGLESATRCIQQYVAEHGSSITAQQEFEVLPAVVSNLSGITTKLKALQTITSSLNMMTPSRSPSIKVLGRKVSWVYHKKSIAALMESLEKDKSNLNLAVDALDL